MQKRHAAMALGSSVMSMPVTECRDTTDLQKALNHVSLAQDSLPTSFLVGIMLSWQ
jgi:hypothetical protein